MWQTLLRKWLWGALTSAARPSAAGKRPPEPPAPDGPCDVGLVFALPQESAALVARLKRTTTTHGHGFVAYDGLLGEHRVVVVNAGAGTAAAARGTDALIVAYHPRLVISAGFAGGLKQELARGHMLLASDVLHENGTRLSVDLKLGSSGQSTVHVGPLLTVNRLIRKSSEKQALHAKTGAVAVDMETLAVAVKCHELKTPFLAVRIISDGVHDELPREISRLIAKPSRLRQVSFALGAMVQRPGVAKDLWKLKQDAQALAETLSRFLGEIIAQLPRRPF